MGPKRRDEEGLAWREGDEVGVRVGWIVRRLKGVVDLVVDG